MKQLTPRVYPYYWAGFVLIGDSSPVWSNNAIPSYGVYLGIAFLAVLMLLFKFSKN